MAVTLLLLFSLCFIQSVTAEMKEGEHCDIGCLVSKIDLAIEFNRTQLCLPEVGTITKSQLCVQTLVINGLELSKIDGFVDNEENPQVFTISVGLSKAHLEVIFWIESKSDVVSGYIVVDVSNVNVNLKFDFETQQYLGYDLIENIVTDITLKDGMKFDEMDCNCYNGGFFKTCSWFCFTFDFASWFSDFIPSIIQGQMDKIEDAANTALTDLFTMANEEYVKPFINSTDPKYIPVPEGMTNVTESSIFDMVSWATTYLLGGNSSLGLNNLIDRFTRNTGDLVVGSKDQDTFPELTPMLMELLTLNNNSIPDLNATIDFGIKYINISGLNTWNNMEFFEPLRNTKDRITNESMCEIEEFCDYQLKLSSGLHRLEINVTFALNITANGSIIQMDGEVMHEEGNLYIKVTENYLEGRMQIAVTDGQMVSYSNNQCTNLTCWLALFQNGTGIPYLEVNTSIDAFLLKATSGDAGSELDKGIRNLLNSIVGVFINKYRPVIPVFLTGMVNELGTTYINDFLADTLNATCDENPDPNVKEYKPAIVASTISIAFVLSMILCAIAIIVLVVKWRFGKNGDETETTATGESKESDSSSEQEEKKPFLQRLKAFPLWFCKQWIRTDAEGASLFLDHRVNIVVRVIIPLFILLNIALFITSNTGTGATVNAYISLGNGQIITMPVSDFGLMNSVEDMWTAGAYPLAVLILVFSGIWPYLKLVVLLFAWFMPSTIVNHKFRGGILKILDALGKWSMLDSYVMVLMIVAFFFDIPLPIRHSESVDDPVKINLYVYPAYGFVTLMLGTITSLVLSHVVVGVHNVVLHDKQSNHGEDGMKWRPLFMYCRFLATKIIMPILLFITFVLIVIGMFLISFSFDFLGLAGWALTILGQSSHREFSVVDLGVQLPGATREPNSFGVRVTQLVYFFTIIVFPLLHLVTLFALWFVPLQRRIQSLLYHACEVLYAWSCIDVFVVSVIAAIVELSQFAAFMVEPMCAVKIPQLGMSIDDIVAEFFGDEYLIEGHETCFEVKANLEGGCWLLFVAVIIYTFISIFIMKVIKRALAKRLPTEEERAVMNGTKIEMAENKEEGEHNENEAQSPEDSVEHSSNSSSPDNLEEEQNNENIMETDNREIVSNDVNQEE